MGIVKLITGLNKRDMKDSPLSTVIEQLPHGWNEPITIIFLHHTHTLALNI